MIYSILILLSQPRPLSTFNLPYSMRRLLIRLFQKPVLRAAKRYSSRPDRVRIFEALTTLANSILKEPGKKGLVIPFEYEAGKFIIFSDQHRGSRNGADDFVLAEPNYLGPLEHYYNSDFTLINLGDSEELWENHILQIKNKNATTFEAEKQFLKEGRMIKIFGNHDLYWANDPLASWTLENIFGEKVTVYEGVILGVTINDKQLKIFCTHGHQGDAQSDGNWFSKFFVSNIWAPLQAFLKINPNTPAFNNEKKTLHNEFMYEWSGAQENTLLITGHTHQPVFASLTHIERLYKQFQFAQFEKNEEQTAALLAEIRKREKEFSAVALDYLSMKPGYFNTGCCCYSDGDITGIEIENGCIRLIKWSLTDGKPFRFLLEEISLKNLVKQL